MYSYVTGFGNFGGKFCKSKIFFIPVPLYHTHHMLGGFRVVMGIFLDLVKEKMSLGLMANI